MLVDLVILFIHSFMKHMVPTPMFFSVPMKKLHWVILYIDILNELELNLYTPTLLHQWSMHRASGFAQEGKIAIPWIGPATALCDV